jgi:DNA-directed RNA polymerase subunit RPC12/RpoP
MPTPATNHWPCESCGADLHFSPGETVLKCPYCGHVQPIPASARREGMGELDLTTALRHGLAPADMEEVRITPCPNCGAQVEFLGAANTGRCPFCATPVSIGTGVGRQIKPQALIPFQLDERTARGAMVAWLGRLWFAPNGLVEYARRGRALSGIYVPYWTFDAATRSAYTGARGEYYYETRTVTVQVNGRSERRQEQVRKTRWYPASGRVARAFDDVLVLASTSLPRSYTDNLAPWDLGALVPHSTDYMAGFASEGYTVGLPEGQQFAHQVMAAQIARDIAADIGGDEQRITSTDIDHSAETFKHILLPVWLAAYKYGGQTFRFVINGQTGKVQGERPYSAWKIAFAVVVAAILVGGFYYISQVQ